MSKDEDYKAFALRFAYEAGNQMRLLFDEIKALRARAETAEAVVSMATKRLGSCHNGNLLQRVDILRESERCLKTLVRSVDELATEVIFRAPDDAYDLTEILRECRMALDAKAT